MKSKISCKFVMDKETGMRFDTKIEAVRSWVGEFNAFPQGMIARLMSNDIDEWTEITKPSIGDQVYVFDKDEYGNIVKRMKNGKYKIELHNNNKAVSVAEEDFEVIRDDLLPMWGTMWQFGDVIDDDWLSGNFGENGLQLMSDCGFRIYEHDEWGYFFGIDGAGYDFYEAHWIPLYDVRGLHWHKDVDKKDIEELKDRWSIDAPNLSSSV